MRDENAELEVDPVLVRINRPNFEVVEHEVAERARVDDAKIT
jgi:hypothetical protein